MNNEDVMPLLAVL